MSINLLLQFISFPRSIFFGTCKLYYTYVFMKQMLIYIRCNFNFM